MTNHRYTCGDTETLVAYLYDELEADRAADVARHLVTCAACEQEIDGLGGVRRALGEWTPPAPPLRFSAVPDVVPASQPASSGWPAVPAWAQLVAATLALAVGAAVANVQVRRDAGGWSLTTGWMTPTAVTAGAPPAPDDAWRPALTALEQSLRRDLTPTRTAAPAPAAAPRLPTRPARVDSPCPIPS